MDIPLLAYQHSILLSLSLPAQVHALRKQVDMLFMPDALNLVVRMYYFIIDEIKLHRIGEVSVCY